MKKYFLISVFILTLVSGLYLRSNKNNHIPELILQNIECLATPEDPNIKCIGRGTVDCPNYDKQVIYYI